MKRSTILLVFLLTMIILAAGCTTRTGSKTPETLVSASPSVTILVTTVPTPSGTAMSVPPEDPGTITVSPRVVSDDPYLEYLNIRKRTFDFSLPNCFMQNAFPAIIQDTYGIKQAVPTLAAISEDDYFTFLRKHTEGDAESTPLTTPAACLGSEADPTWNFIEVRVILSPRNVRASDYTITKNLMSDGKTVVQLSTTRRLVLDEKVILVSYIPIRTDEIDLFDTVEMTYTRH